MVLKKQFSIDISKEEAAYCGYNRMPRNDGYLFMDRVTDRNFGAGDELVGDVFEELPESTQEGIGCASTDDVAALVLFLASDESISMTADNILIDGGQISMAYPDEVKLINESVESQS